MAEQPIEGLHDLLRGAEAALMTARAAERQKKRKDRASSRIWKLTEKQLRATLICFVLGGGVVDPALVYLREQGRKRRWPERNDDDLAITFHTKWAGV